MRNDIRKKLATLFGPNHKTPVKPQSRFCFPGEKPNQLEVDRTDSHFENVETGSLKLNLNCKNSCVNRTWQNRPKLATWILCDLHRDKPKIKTISAKTHLLKVSGVWTQL